jgi:hypothetical protein
MSDDKNVIQSLGGPARVAELLGYDKHGGVQRVQNWTVRGIPAKVRLDNPHIFPNLHREGCLDEARAVGPHA